MAHRAADAAPAPRAATRSTSASTGVALVSGIGLSLLFIAALSTWVLAGLDGWDYYTTPITIRGYHPAHATLRPSGAAGIRFGIAGAALMLVPFAYMLLKRHPRLRRGTALKGWLELHIFCGIAGPALVSYHTSFKFNGLVSVAYWSMVLVAASGFVGRYLYVRIPRTIRGVEMTGRELADRLATLRDEVAGAMPPELMDRLAAFEAECDDSARRRSAWRFLFGSRRARRTARALEAELRRTDADESRIQGMVAAMHERRRLVDRLASLHTTHRLFELWHVWHLPLVYVMFAIVVMHVAVVVYLGYGPSW